MDFENLKKMCHKKDLISHAMIINIHNLVVLVGEMDEEGVDRIAESASDVIEEATSDNYFHLFGV